MDWFLYDNGLRHERVKRKNGGLLRKKEGKEVYLKIRPSSLFFHASFGNYILINLKESLKNQLTILTDARESSEF